MWIEFPDQGTFSREWLEAHPEQLQALLARCKGRYPLCKCREPGLPLYIARRQRLYLARLPNSGPRHAPQCPSYEPEAALCGRVLYSTRALQEMADGRVTIKLGVPLLIRSSTPATTAIETAGLTEGTTRDALGLTGLLHLLWDRSEFNRWTPRMRHRRHYRQWRKYVLESAQDICLKRHALTRHLYLPEPYSPAQALEIEARRQRTFRELAQAERGSPMRILVLGRVRTILESAGRVGLRLSHLPNEFVIGVSATAVARLRHRLSFAWIDGHALHPEFQLFVLMTIQRDREGLWQANELTGLITGEAFIPLFSIEEALLCRRLIDEDRAFYKPLPYDGAIAQFPNLILMDCGDSGVPLEVVSTDAREAAIRRSRIDMYRSTQQPHWVWDTHQAALPPAPAAAVQPIQSAARPSHQ